MVKLKEDNNPINEHFPTHIRHDFHDGLAEVFLGPVKCIGDKYLIT